MRRYSKDFAEACDSLSGSALWMGLPVVICGVKLEFTVLTKVSRHKVLDVRVYRESFVAIED